MHGFKHKLRQTDCIVLCSAFAGHTFSSYLTSTCSAFIFNVFWLYMDVFPVDNVIIIFLLGTCKYELLCCLDLT